MPIFFNNRTPHTAHRTPHTAHRTPHTAHRTVNAITHQHTQFTFLRKSTLSSIAWIFLFSWICISNSYAQSRPCQTPACGQLKVEALRTETNLITNCTDLTGTTFCGNKSYQMLIDVYLKYVNGGDDPFNLNYGNLDVKVNLKQVTANQRSYIDINATNTCFLNSPTGSKWSSYSNTDGNRVIFSATEQSVDISFRNTNTSDACGSTSSNGGSTKIEFDDTTPPNAAPCFAGKCYYVKLFTVVVNAYPGEYVALDLDPNQTDYTPFSGGPLSCPNVNNPAIGIENAGTLIYNGFFQGNLIASPNGNTGTQNADLELQMTGPVLTNGKHEFTLKLANTNSSDAIIVNHLDFYVKVSLKKNDEIPTFAGSYLPKSVVYKGVDPNNSAYKYYLLHYDINGFGTINGNSTSTLGVIQIPNPTLTTINWDVILSTSGQTGRVNTTKIKGVNSSVACTDLKSTVNSTYALTTQQPMCIDTDVVFDVETVSNGCVNDFVYKVGLRSLSGFAVRKIARLEFELVFDTDSDVTISGVDDSDFDINCTLFPSQSCVGTSCYAFSGNTFNYCFNVLNINAQTIQIEPSQYMEVKFAHTANGCVNGFKITKLIIRYVDLPSDLAPCVPMIYPTINPNTQSVDLSICGPILAGKVAIETTSPVSDVAIKASTPTTGTSCNCSGSCADATELTNKDGKYGFCSLCSTCSKFTLTPTKNDNPLNGVSTFDLVLISKHILGIEPLNSPYKMIAADANKSNSITTFDIVEFRKLILGIYSLIPNNTSWRFVPKDFTFPNVLNPFESVFDESIKCADPTQAKPFDFVAIKVGDVNNNAIGSAKPSDRPITTISWANTGAKSGTTLSIPVVYTGLETLEALQLGLKFDPSRYQLIGTAPGDLSGYTSANFGLTQAGKGEIRTLWFPSQNPDERIKPGTVLFYLNFKVSEGAPDATFELVLDNNLLSNLAWQQDGTEFSIAGASASERIPAEDHKSENTLQVNVQPNPSSGAVSMSINAPQAMKARIVLFSAAGHRVLLRDVTLSEGEQLVALPEVLNLPAGIYSWKVYAGGSKAHGQLVKN